MAPLLAWRGAPVAGLVIVLFVVDTVLTPAFAGAYSLTGFFATYLPSICLAVGLSFTLLVGGIDLSVGPVMGLCGIVTVLLNSVGWHLFSLGPDGSATTCADPGICNQGIPFLAAGVGAVVVGAIFGAANGLAVAVLRLQPLVATLATGFVAGGVSLWLFPKPGGQVSSSIGSTYTAARIPPIPLVVGIVVTVVAYLITRSPLGVRMRAVGSDRPRAYAAGVNVMGATVAAYTLSGVLAGVAGVMLTLNVSSADPTIGVTFTMNAVAGAVLGGTALRGGWAEPFGPALGAVALGLLNSLVIGLNIPVYYQQLVSGLVIIAGLAGIQGVFRQRSA